MRGADVFDLQGSFDFILQASPEEKREDDR